MQFEDAPGDTGPDWKIERVPRIDEASVHSDSLSTDSEEEEDQIYESEDSLDEEDYSEFVNAAGWEDMGGDLTKRYNRLRQHVSASTSQHVPGTSSEKSLPRSSGVLPAVNRPRQQQASTTSKQAESKAPVHANKMESSLADLTHRFGGQLNLNLLDQNATTAGAATRKGGTEKVAHKDKSDRATTEQVLDPRTRLVLFKMLNRGLLSKIEGCISTGKEANVYHALSGQLEERELPPQLALKIYKTSILVFKDRNRYVTGEYRFKSGYSGSNPRKMVRLWAEKELRNLRRLRKAGVPSPEPIEVRNNVLVMEFLGPGIGWNASPRLKDASIPDEEAKHFYFELLHWMRVMYQQCKLVHADLSEYNILLHEGRLFMIDVSQSVEHDHPHAFDFLRNDIKNAEDFFAKRGVTTIGLRRAFDFITVPSTSASTAEPTLETSAAELENILEQPEDDDGDAVFAQSWIPRRLNEVADPERDVAKVAAGESDSLIYAKTMGVAQSTSDVPLPEDASNPSADGAEDDEEAEESQSGSESEEASDVETEARPKGKKFEDKDAKKERKVAVKDAKREKRKTKIPKKVKQKQMAKTSGKR